MGKKNAVDRKFIKNDSEVIARRRQLVADLRLRGATFAQIQKALAEGGKDGVGQFLNPETGQPFSVGVIHKDCKELEAQWHTEAIQSISTHKGVMLAKYAAIERMAWQKNDFDVLLKTLKAMRELLGTDAPQVLMLERLESKMVEALEKLHAEFRGEPATFKRILKAFLGDDFERFKAATEQWSQAQISNLN